MADNYSVLTANGTTTATFRATDNGAGVLIVNSIPTNIAGTAMIGQAVMASSIPVAIASNQSNLSVLLAGGTATLAGGTTTVTLAGGTAALAGGTASVTLAGGTANITQIGGVNFALGQAIMATSLPVAIASNQSNVPVNLAAVGNTTFGLGQAVMATSIPVAIASNQSNVPFNMAAVGGSTFSLGTKIAATSISVALATDQVQSTNLVQVGGVAFALGTQSIASSLPVVLATNSPGVITFGQAVMATSLPVAIASDQTNVPIGVVGYTSFPSAVANAARVAGIGDKIGRLVAVGAARDWKASQTSSLTTAAETVIVNALNATTFADLYGLILANTGSTTTKVDIRYGIGSAIVMSFEVPTVDTRGFMVPVDSALPGSIQSANFSWTAQCAATAAINVTALYVKNV